MHTSFFASILVTCTSVTFSIKETQFKKTRSAFPAVLDDFKQLQIQKVFGLTKCAILCSQMSCKEFQYSDTGRLCITRHADAVSSGVINPGSVFFDTYNVSQQDPQTCADIRKDNPAADSGEYNIMPSAPQFKGMSVKVFCLMNDAHQLEYVTLPNENIGNYPKKSNGNCRKERPYLPGRDGRHGVTVYQKIRIIPSTMAVKRTDTTFTSGNKTKPHVFGRAEDCYSYVAKCKKVGTFHINTLGTGMKFATDLKWIGTTLGKLYKINRSHNGAVIDLVCGGWCGGCNPIGGMILYPNSLDTQL